MVLPLRVIKLVNAAKAGTKPELAEQPDARRRSSPSWERREKVFMGSNKAANEM